MRFYLGVHHPNWLLKEADLFVSRRRMHTRKNLPVAAHPWALDSGGFTELSKYGDWTISEETYVALVERFRDEIGKLEWAAPMDWMCEPQILAKTGKTVAEHQRLTVDNFLRLREALGELVIPVLQGWELDDYQRCVELYEQEGVNLSQETLVGVGSVCRRQDTWEAQRIFRSLNGLALHGFGVKLTGIRAFKDMLASCDSMAWSWEARRVGRRFDRQEPLFEWPKTMLCGKIHPEEHKAKNCANCRAWALLWRETVLNTKLEVGA